MSHFTPFEPRPDDEPFGRRRFRPTRREVLRTGRRERPRGCGVRGAVRPARPRRRLVPGCPRGR